MSDWFTVMFPDAEDEEELVQLYSFHTVLGDWQIHTPVRTFEFQPIKQTNFFYLFWEDEEESSRVFDSVFAVIKCVHSHSTGVSKWDESTFEASDYLPDWKREVPDRVVFNYLDLWMQWNPKGSLRQLVDYFEHESTHLIDRHNISEFLKEMIVTGQITSFPSDSMAPAELRLIVRLAKKYGVLNG